MLWMWITLGVILFVGISIAGGASRQFYDSYKKRNGIVSDIGFTAADFAKDVIKKRQLPITCVRTEGEFNDFYSHKARVIAISDDLYMSPNVVALGVTAHELGHAITDFDNNIIYRSHSFLRGFVNVLSKLVYLILIAAIVLFFFEEYIFISKILLYVVLGIFALCLFFQILTVGNERSATKTAIQLLKDYGMPKNEIKIVKNVLNAALLTYIGAIFMPIVKVLRFIGKIFDVTLGRLFK